MHITGSLIEAYIFCPRQAWLIAHQIPGNQYNEFLEIGRLISEESFKREKKEILLKGGKVDFIKKEKNLLTLVEVKKSEKYVESAKMQLLFYMKNLKDKGYNVTGEIRIPKTKKVIYVDLQKSDELELEKTVKNINELCSNNKIPEAKLISKCKNCAYFEFCWS